MKKDAIFSLAPAEFNVPLAQTSGDEVVRLVSNSAERSGLKNRFRLLSV